MLIKVDYLFWLVGIILAITSSMTLFDRAHPKRWTTGAFWGVFAVLFWLFFRLTRVLETRLAAAISRNQSG